MLFSAVFLLTLRSCNVRMTNNLRYIHRQKTPKANRQINIRTPSQCCIKVWSPEQYRDRLSHPLAERQFKNDLEAIRSCDACVLVLPCGRSAHTEAGWFAGAGKPVGGIYTREGGARTDV